MISGYTAFAGAGWDESAVFRACWPAFNTVTKHGVPPVSSRSWQSH